MPVFQYEERETFPDGQAVGHADRQLYFLDDADQPVSAPFDEISYIDDGVYAVQCSTGVAPDQSHVSGIVREDALSQEWYVEWEQGIDYVETVRSHSRQAAGPVYPAVTALDRTQLDRVDTGRGTVLAATVRARALALYESLFR